MSEPIKTGTGTSLFIGTTMPASTQEEFERDTYTEISDISEIGPFGDQRNSVTFASLKDGRIRKGRGTADAGDVQVVFAHRTGDPGQDALRAAYETQSHSQDEFNFRLVLNDQIDPDTGRPTTFYFRAKVMSRQVQSITNDSVILVAVTLAINSAPIEVKAT